MFSPGNVHIQETCEYRLLSEIFIRCNYFLKASIISFNMS